MKIIRIPEEDGLGYSDVYDEERRGPKQQIDATDKPCYIELYDCNGEPLFRSKRIGF